MKKRLHDKKAGIAILISLIIISLVEIIFRAVSMGEAVLTTSNLGEQLAVIVLAAIILTLVAKGKDRACYICCGALIAYFILDQFIELPGVIFELIASTVNSAEMILLVIAAPMAHVISMITTIAIGWLLVKYMVNGTINNRAFNILCGITVAFLLFNTIVPVFLTIGNVGGMANTFLVLIFHNLYRITMVFFTTFFAYDSAKHQLKKTDLTK